MRSSSTASCARSPASAVRASPRRLAATAGQLTWGHRQVFSRLDAMAQELRADRSKLQLAKAVTLYHIIVEASLAQSG
jgi:hypothetical protein